MQKIHPLWFVCLLTRVLLIVGIVLVISNHKSYKNYAVVLLAIMGSGFIYKYITGSNNEKQIAKVFWHDSRLLHGILYLTASFYVFVSNVKMTTIVLSIDIIGSLIYRFM